MLLTMRLFLALPFAMLQSVSFISSMHLLISYKYVKKTVSTRVSSKRVHNFTISLTFDFMISYNKIVII